MELKLTRFRGIADRTIKLPSSGTVLLTGESGAGKTTILDAISFVFHGKPSDIYPKEGTKTTSVLLQTATLRILRQKRPGLLRVEVDGERYENDAAQGWIDTHYSENRIWECTSYLRQGEYCTFLSLTSAEKLDLLRSIAIGQSDLITRMIEQCSRYNEEVTRELDEYDKKNEVRKCLYLDYWESLSEEVRSAETELCSEEDLKITEKELIELKGHLQDDRSQLQNLQLDLRTAISNEKIIRDLQAQLRRLAPDLPALRASAETIVERINIATDLKQRWSSLKEYQTLTNQLSLLSEDIPQISRKDYNCLRSCLGDEQLVKLTLQEYQERQHHIEQEIKIAEQAAEYRRNKDQLDHLERLLEVANGIPLEELSVVRDDFEQERKIRSTYETIVGKIDQLPSESYLTRSEIRELYSLGLRDEKLQDYIQHTKDAHQNALHQHNYNRYQEYTRLLQIASIATIDPTPKIRRLEDDLVIARLNSDAMTCPECKCKLMIKDGKLLTVHVKSVNVSVAAVEEELRIEHQKLTQYQKAQDAREQIADRFPKPPPKISQPETSSQLESIDVLETRLKGLEKFSDRPNVTLEEAEKALTGVRKRQELQEELSSLQPNPDWILDTLDQEIVHIGEAISLYQHYSTVYQMKPLEELRRLCQQEIIYSGPPKDDLQLELQIIKNKIQTILPYKDLTTTLGVQMDLIRNQELRQQLQEKLQKFKSITIPEESEEGLDQELKKLEQERRDISSVISRADLLQSNIEKIKVPRSSDELKRVIAKLEERITSKDLMASEQEQFITTNRQRIKLFRLYDEYQDSSNILIDLQEKITTVQKVKNAIISAECLLIDNLLNSINHVMNETLTHFFNEPITVELSSFRELKTKSRIKAEIVLTINYRGMTFNKLSQLSGGEKSRISVALTVALSKCLGSKQGLLMIDESVSTLGGSSRDAVIKGVKMHLPSKLIMVVNHDTTEGVYDQVIEI